MGRVRTSNKLIFKPQTNPTMAKQDKSTLQVTKALHQTLKYNPKIKEVYFNEDGDFFFKKHKVKIHHYDPENLISSGVEDVESLPGVSKTAVRVKTVTNGVAQYQFSLVNTDHKPIAATFTREEILSMPAVAEKRTEKEKLEILLAAKEISESGDLEALLAKIKATK